MIGQANAYIGQKAFREAVYVYDKVLKIDKNNVEATNGLGWLGLLFGIPDPESYKELLDDDTIMLRSLLLEFLTISESGFNGTLDIYGRTNEPQKMETLRRQFESADDNELGELIKGEQFGPYFSAMKGLKELKRIQASLKGAYIRFLGADYIGGDQYKFYEVAETVLANLGVPWKDLIDQYVKIAHFGTDFNARENAVKKLTDLSKQMSAVEKEELLKKLLSAYWINKENRRGLGYGVSDDQYSAFKDIFIELLKELGANEGQLDQWHVDALNKGHLDSRNEAAIYIKEHFDTQKTFKYLVPLLYEETTRLYEKWDFIRELLETPKIKEGITPEMREILIEAYTKALEKHLPKYNPGQPLRLLTVLGVPITPEMEAQDAEGQRLKAIEDSEYEANNPTSSEPDDWSHYSILDRLAQAKLGKESNAYWIYTALAAPAWEEGAFRWSLGFAIQHLLAGNALGIGSAAVASIVLFAAAHVIANWFADRKDNPGASLRDAFKKEFGHYVFPSFIFTAFFFGAFYFLPFHSHALFAAYAAGAAAHSVWNILALKYNGIKLASIFSFKSSGVEQSALSNDIGDNVTVESADGGAIGKFDSVKIIPDESNLSPLLTQIKLAVNIRLKSGGTEKLVLHGVRAPAGYKNDDFADLSTPATAGLFAKLKMFVNSNQNMDDIIVEKIDFEPGSKLQFSDFGGFAISLTPETHRPIRVLSVNLASSRIARFHELVHLARGAEKVSLEDVRGLLTDGAIRQSIYDEKTRFNSSEAVKMHYALRAFQRQYFRLEDENLSRRIKMFKLFERKFPTTVSDRYYKGYVNEIVKSAIATSNLGYDWASVFLELFKKSNPSDKVTEAFSDALKELVFNRNKQVRMGAAWILSQPEFLGPVKGLPNNDIWQDASVMHVLLDYSDPAVLDKMYENSSRDTLDGWKYNPRKRHWMESQVLSAILNHESPEQENRARALFKKLFQENTDEDVFQTVERDDPFLFSELINHKFISIDSSKKQHIKKILFVATEMAPFCKTGGGVRDVTGELTTELAALGQEVTAIIPNYRTITESIDTGKTIEMPLGDKTVTFKLKKAQHGNVTVYFLENEYYFSDPYPPEEDPKAFEEAIFLSRAPFEICKALDYYPDIMHANDWQTGLIPAYLKHVYNQDPHFSNTKCVYTIHNLGYRGKVPESRWHLAGFPDREDGQNRYLEEYHDYTEKGIGYLSLERVGMEEADEITTVSGQYRKEILLNVNGLSYGFQELLQRRAGVKAGAKTEAEVEARGGSHVSGVLNGINLDNWNPETDSDLVFNYGVSNFEQEDGFANFEKVRLQNKMAFLREVGLKPDENTFLIGGLSRITGQKGLQLIPEALDRILKENPNAQFVFIGDEGNDKEYSDKFILDIDHLIAKYRVRYQGKYYDRIKRLPYSASLSRRFYASCDIELFCSQYEPFNVDQLKALRYGCIPVARATGGLEEVITQYNPKTGDGYGFKFNDFTSDALYNAMADAISTMETRIGRKYLREHAMSCDFSWGGPAKQYNDLYESMLGSKHTGHEKLIPLVRANFIEAVEVSAEAAEAGLNPAKRTVEAADILAEHLAPYAELRKNAPELINSSVVRILGKPGQMIGNEAIDEAEALRELGMQPFIITTENANCRKDSRMTIVKNADQQGADDTIYTAFSDIHINNRTVAVRAYKVKNSINGETLMFTLDSDWDTENAAANAEIMYKGSLAFLQWLRGNPVKQAELGISLDNNGPDVAEMEGEIYDAARQDFNMDFPQSELIRMSVTTPEGIAHQVQPAGIRGEANKKYVSDMMQYAKAFAMKVYPGVVSKRADSIGKSGTNIGKNVSIHAQRKADVNNDPGVGKIGDILSGYLDKLQAVGGNCMQLMSFNQPKADDPEDPASLLLGDELLVDWAAAIAFLKLNANEIKDIALPGAGEVIERDRVEANETPIASKVMALFLESKNHNALKKEYTDWKNNNKQPRSDEIHKFAQWLFEIQMRDMIVGAHSRGVKVYFTLNLTKENCNGNNAPEAVKHWMRMGFDGVRLNFKDAGLVADNEMLKMIKTAVLSTNPEALVSVKATDEDMRFYHANIISFGFVPVYSLSKLPGSLKERSNVWLEVDQYTDGIAPTASEQDYKKAAQRAILSGAPFVSFFEGFFEGDLTHYSKTYRRPLEGDDRRNKFAGRLGAKIKELSELGHPVSPEALYNQGYRAGLNELPETDGKGYEAFAAQADTLSREYLSVRSGDALPENYVYKELFTSARKSLSAVNGLSEDKWAKGWGYLQVLERSMETSTGEEQFGRMMQFFGFIRGINEKLVEQHDVHNEKIVMSDNESQNTIIRALLVLIHINGLKPSDVLDLKTSHPAPAGASGPIVKANSIEDSQGKLEAINPVIAEILRNGGIMPESAYVQGKEELAKLSIDEITARKYWAISELFRIFYPLAERKTVVQHTVNREVNVLSVMAFGRAG